MRSHGAAVIGTGLIGPVHVEALRRLGQPVVGILASSPAKSQAAAQALHIPRGYADLQELLSDPEVEVVHIASPNRYHYDQAKATLRAGKHVVCEKPLAMTPEESGELLSLAQKAGVIHAVCYNIRFYPLCLEARQWVQDGKVGPIYHILGSYLQDWLLFDTDFNWRVVAETGGALRAVADIGTHWLDLIQFITGLEVESVCADLQTVHVVRQAPRGSMETFQTAATDARQPVPINTEDQGSILLHFHGGARGCLTVSQVTAGRKNCLRFEMAGAQACLAWNSEVPNDLWVGRRAEPNALITRDPQQLHPAVRDYTNYPPGHAEGFPDTFKQLFRAIYASIDSKDARECRPVELPYPTFQDGDREVRLCAAILQSHVEQRWVRI